VLVTDSAKIEAASPAEPSYGHPVQKVVLTELDSGERVRLGEGANARPVALGRIGVGRKESAVYAALSFASELTLPDDRACNDAVS